MKNIDFYANTLDKNIEHLCSLLYMCAHCACIRTEYALQYCIYAASNGISPQSTKVFSKRQTKTRWEISKPTKDRKHKNIEEVRSLLRNSSFFSRKEPHKNSINIVDMFCGELNAISFPFCFLFYLRAPCMWPSLWAFCRMCFFSSSLVCVEK